MSSFYDPYNTPNVQPSGVSLRSVLLTADQVLFAPQSGMSTENVLAANMEVDEDGVYSFFLPDALGLGVGTNTRWNNVGSYSFTVKDSEGGTVQVVAPGEYWETRLTDNSTSAGTWVSNALGIGTFDPSTSGLAGKGLIADGDALDQNYAVTTTNTTSRSLTSSDRASTIAFVGGASTFTLDYAASLGDGWFVKIRNEGTGVLSIHTSGTDNINSASFLSINPGDSCEIDCDGTSKFYTIGLGRNQIYSLSRIIIDVSGSVDYTLTSSQSSYDLIEFSGTLLANINVIFPELIQSWHVNNSVSTSTYTLTCKTASGTGVVIPYGTRKIVDGDGINIVYANSVPTLAVSSDLSFTPSGDYTDSDYLKTIGLGITSVVSGAYSNFTVDTKGRLTGATKVINAFKNADIASATTTDIGSITDGNVIDITGNVTIASFGTVSAGAIRSVRFTGTPTITYNATSMILPTSADIVAAAGDTATFISLGSGNWYCSNYQRKSGHALIESVVPMITVDTTLNVGTGQTYDTINAAMAYLSGYRINNNVTVTIQLAAETHAISAAQYINHLDGDRIVVTGVASSVSTAATSISATSGSSGNYSITFVVADSSSFVVGRYAYILSTTGTGYHYCFRGLYKIASKPDATHITLTCQMLSSLPAKAGLTGATIYMDGGTILSYAGTSFYQVTIQSSLKDFRNIVFVQTSQTYPAFLFDTTCKGAIIAGGNTSFSGRAGGYLGFWNCAIRNICLGSIEIGAILSSCSSNAISFFLNDGKISFQYFHSHGYLMHYSTLSGNASVTTVSSDCASNLCGSAGSGVYCAGYFQFGNAGKCNISYCGGYGVNIASGTRIILNFTTIEDCANNGISNIGGNLEFYGATSIIKNCSGAGVYSSDHAHSLLDGCSITSVSGWHIHTNLHSYASRSGATYSTITPSVGVLSSDGSYNS